MIDLARERKLIVKAKQGDTQAFERLMIENAPYIYNRIFRILGDSVEAEDVTQEVFVIAWQKLSAFRGDSRLSTWLYRIASNLCYQRLPKIKTQRELAKLSAIDSFPNDNPTIEKRYMAVETREILQRSIASLPERYRTLIRMRHLQGFAYSEIAEITKLPLGTVKNSIFRGKQILKERFESLSGFVYV